MEWHLFQCDPHILFHDSCVTANRVGKCHGYDGYIRVKKWAVGVKSLGGQNNYQKQAIFGKICTKNSRSMDKLQ